MPKVASELMNLRPYLEEAPEYVRQFMEIAIGIAICIFVLQLILRMLKKILKDLYSEPYQRAYRTLGSVLINAGKAGKVLATQAVEALQLPEPYPRLRRFFEGVFMVSNYATAFYFGFTGIFIVIATMALGQGFLAWISAVFVGLVLLFFAWFFFAEAERARTRHFRKTEVKQVGIEDEGTNAATGP